MVEKIWRAGLWIRLEQRIIRAQHELDEDGRVNGGHIYRRERFKQIERVTTNFCPKIRTHGVVYSRRDGVLQMGRECRSGRQRTAWRNSDRRAEQVLVLHVLLVLGLMPCLIRRQRMLLRIEVTKIRD